MGSNRPRPVREASRGRFDRRATVVHSVRPPRAAAFADGDVVYAATVAMNRAAEAVRASHSAMSPAAPAFSGRSRSILGPRRPSPDRRLDRPAEAGAGAAPSA